uniref:Uncharacterized protein n=1 Tax=Arundo donax TaxID=35708 RepID=A0A0A9GZ18_ARUDO
MTCNEKGIRRHQAVKTTVEEKKFPPKLVKMCSFQIKWADLTSTPAVQTSR